MVLYIVRNNMLGFTRVMDAESPMHAAHADAGLRGYTLDTVLPAMDTAHVHIVNDGRRAPRPIVTAQVADATRETRDALAELHARAGGPLFVNVYRGFTPDGWPEYQGHYGLTPGGYATATHWGDRDLTVHAIRQEIEAGHVGPGYASVS